MGHKPQQGGQSLRQSWLNGPWQRWHCEHAGHSHIVGHYGRVRVVRCLVQSRTEVVFRLQGTRCRIKHPTQSNLKLHLLVIRYRPHLFPLITPLHLPQPTPLHIFNNSSNDGPPSFSFFLFAGGKGKIICFLQNKQLPKDSPSKGTLCEERTVCSNWDNSPTKGTQSLTGNLLCGRTMKHYKKA